MTEHNRQVDPVRRWSIEWRDDALQVCRGEHDKSAACAWERFIPVVRVERLRTALAEALDEWENAAQYKGEYLVKKHEDAEEIARLRAILAELI